jgi:acyl-CoA synthetase (NDP forming)
MSAKSLDRLLRPRSIAFVGGRHAEEALHQCRKLGFAGEVWPVNPKRAEMDGVACFPDLASLPAAPDAVFLATPAEASIALVGQLAAMGAGGTVCYASDFAEAGDHGAERQARLTAAADKMPLIGPNCYGVLNAFDCAGLWPDQHGCAPLVGRGVAIVTQSGNLGLNFTMQRRALPLGYMIAIGNAADVDAADLVEALLRDERVSAIGLHIEGLKSVARFSQACLAARRAGVPLVALKAGASERGAKLTMSHTSSLAGPDALYDALFDRFGVARAADPAQFIETLKLLHTCGPLTGRSVTSASCSGGEASLIADLAERRGLETPDFPAPVQDELERVLGPLVSVSNPLDYHTHIWGDGPAQTACFAGMLKAGFAASLLALDYPRADRCDDSEWDTALDAFVTAHRKVPPAPGQARIVVSSLPENLPEHVAVKLLDAGIVPMMGFPEALGAISTAAKLAESLGRPEPVELADPAPFDPASVVTWDESVSKAALRRAGLRGPLGATLSFEELAALCRADSAELPVPFPLALKVVSAEVAHKSDLGGVSLNLKDKSQVLVEAERMRTIGETFLLEEMISGALAELIVGLSRDPQFGLYLTIGAGGVLVELLRQSAQVLLPATRADIGRALESLPFYPLLIGYRGSAKADIPALIDAIEAIARFAAENEAHLYELDVNPLLALPKGAVAVDALVRIKEH